MTRNVHIVHNVFNLCFLINEVTSLTAVEECIPHYYNVDTV